MDEIVAAARPLGPMLMFQAAFLIFWLCGWTFGGITVLTKIAAGKGSAFETIWMLGWVLGETFAAFTLFRLLRPSISERFLLRADGLDYDSGVGPPEFGAGYNRRPSWREISPKRVRRVFSRRELETLRLREGDATSRLTIDCGVDRIDLAKSCTEIEREWLYQQLRDRYLPIDR